jgi:hypothetical protein
MLTAPGTEQTLCSKLSFFFFVYNNYIINNKSDKSKNLKSTNDSKLLVVMWSKRTTVGGVFV